MIKVNGKDYEYSFFPDGTLLMKYGVEEDTDEIQYRITWLFENLTEQVVLQNLVWHIQEKNPSAKITLRLSYVLNGRMDRTQNPDEIFTLKYFARFINELGFYRVYIIDPHSSVASALINKVFVDNEQFKKIIDKVIGKVKPDLLYYPDNGCQKRLEGLIRHPHIIGYKDRDWDSGEILDTEILGTSKIDIAGKTILMVDDICSYGGTFYFAGEKLKELGAGEIHLYITHCENSILEGKLINSGLLKKIYTTNSIYKGEHPLIEVVGSVDD